MGALVGRRVLVTRPAGQGDRLAEAIQSAGGHVLRIPVFEIAPVPPNGAAQEALASLSSYDWCAFTSENAVRHFLDWVDAAGVRWPLRLRTAAVGPATARALKARGREADLVPDPHTGRALGERLASKVPPGRLLAPGGDQAREDLHEILQRAGWEVTRLVCYENRALALTHSQVYALEQGLDAALFASPSAVRALWGQIPESARNVLRAAACLPIGPTTAAALREAGLEPAAVPEAHTTEGVLAALENVLAHRPR
ncbi:MAG: uroporphyrinogen-III synthase [Acidobacteriota bacterium]